MLEALVPSRVRRTLFEYLLAHPKDRFYLRGLAKELGLSVSPLRRELKRLEDSGLLAAVDEGNMRFYTVNIASLRAKGLGVEQPTPQPAASVTTPPLPGAGFVSGPAIPIGVIRLPAEASAQAGARPVRWRRRLSHGARPAASFWTAPLSAPMLIGVAALGTVVMFIVVWMAYLTSIIQRTTASASKPSVTVIAPSEPSASGVMRSPRWRLIPGNFGGFSPPGTSESY